MRSHSNFTPVALDLFAVGYQASGTEECVLYKATESAEPPLPSLLPYLNMDASKQSNDHNRSDEKIDGQYKSNDIEVSATDIDTAAAIVSGDEFELDPQAAKAVRWVRSSSSEPRY
jgi:hypothetical protein